VSEHHKRVIAAALAATSVGGTLAATAGGGPGTAEGAVTGREPTREGLPAPPSGGDIVRADWDLPVERNDRVDFFIEFLMGKNRDKTKEWLQRLGKYAPYLRQELRARNMPEDLVFLAFIESGLNPNAYSRADAAGLWQFIAETGRRYGLEVSEYVDERRDPIKATRAALDYLGDLHDRFGSWYLAAAAYNTGENRVERILGEKAGGRKGDEALYWQISSAIPRETRDYVPLMLAAGHIGKDPAKYGFTDLRYEDPLSFDVVRVPANTPLADVARAAGVDEETIYDLNPHLVKKRTPPDRDWNVRVPVGTAETVAANFGGGSPSA